MTEKDSKHIGYFSATFLHTADVYKERKLIVVRRKINRENWLEGRAMHNARSVKRRAVQQQKTRLVKCGQRFLNEILIWRYLVVNDKQNQFIIFKKLDFFITVNYTM